VALVHPQLRRLTWDWLRTGSIRRRLRAGLVGARATTPDGSPGLIWRVWPMPAGFQAQLWLRPGQSVEEITSRREEIRAALRCRDVHITGKPGAAHLARFDIITRDPLAVTAVAWADADTGRLSVFDPVHFGVTETGTMLRLPIWDRAILVGGNRGAGKSSGLTVFVAHAARSSDAQLLLVDANRLQLGPWQDRALLFADHRVDDAIDLIRLWRNEIDRRLTILQGVAGMPLQLDRDLAARLGWPVWLLVIDELAYYLSVGGTSAQQKEFYQLLRDGVARGRAAGVVAILSTQRPTHDIVPTSLRDLCDIRIAYRTMTRISSDVILGDDMSRRGYTATDIDLNARGVAWVWADGPSPTRVKTVWIPTKLRQRLATETAPFRAARLPGDTPPTAGVRA
jgi:S-DNA-T family DNA segregation ATPase FtsK/SpoIIIE